jgi:hypothetical protein
MLMPTTFWYGPCNFHFYKYLILTISFTVIEQKDVAKIGCINYPGGDYLLANQNMLLSLHPFLECAVLIGIGLLSDS